MDVGLRRRKRRARSAALVLFASLGPAGCATTPGATPRAAPRPLRTATLDEVLAAYDGYCNGIQTVSASGDLDVRDLRAGKAHRVGVRLAATRGGRLYLKGSVAVVTALEVVSDGERFWFQVPSKKTVWTGAAAAGATREAGTEQAPYYALRPGDVTSALLPEPLAPGDADAVVMEGDGQTFALALARLEGGRGLVRRRVWLSRETLLPVRARSYDAQGGVVSEMNLGAWEDGAPRRVSLERPADGYQALFSLSRVQVNVSVPEKAFVPRTPEGYRVVEVR